MKNLKAPFLVIALLLLNFSFAQTHQLPTPDEAGTMSEGELEPNEDNPCLGCGPRFPIDENIAFLLVGGLVLGAVVVYKNKIKKASV